MAKWTIADVPDQTGRTFIVTGANSGLGAAAALALAERGATVVLACRNVEKGAAAAATMAGDVSVRRLDLADLASVRAFAADTGPFDVLVNNAGVMAVPLARTVDGFESQIGTNFLGHFALSLQLLPLIGDRVVTVSSKAHRWGGRINVDDLNWQRRAYRKWFAYGQSKLADLLFAYELQRRLQATGSSVRSVAAHPGYSATELQQRAGSRAHRLMSLGNRILAQNADRGALPTLYAATMPDVLGGDYWGPDGPLELVGHPTRVGSSRSSKDGRTAVRLWGRAEELTGATFG